VAIFFLKKKKNFKNFKKQEADTL